MKARKSILGLLLIIGMLFSCAAASYADTATKAPKIKTSKLEAGEHGGTYSQTIEAENNLDEDGNVTQIQIPAAAVTALEKFGINVTENAEDGSLTLATADGETLKAPTSGYKFTVTVTNKWRKANAKEDDPFTTGTAKKDFTLKITGIVPEIVSPDTETYSEISSLAAPENSSYPVKGTPITDVPFTTNEASPKVVMTATGLPKGLSFKATNQPTTGEPAATTYTLSGTPTETGTFKITIKAENADKKGTGISKAATAKYTMNVLDIPGVTPTSFKDVTFGKTFNQKFTVTGVSKAVSLTSADVGVYVDDEFVALKDAGYGTLTGTYENGKFTISGAVTSYDFGEASTATIPVVFRMTSPAMSEPKEVTMNLKVLATAPMFTNKSDAQTAVSELTKGTEITSFDVIATGPGTITWTVSDLPDGLESTADDPTVDGTKSTIKISGIPTVTAKNFPVDITAKNAKGSTKITLKFTIDGEAPVVTMVPDVTTSADEPSYAQLGVNSGDVDITMSADSGPVTWKVTKLPKGINLVLTDADGKTVNTKTSQYAKIKGKATAAMKDTDVVTVTATDPNTRKSSEPIELAGLHVYPVPTIKTKKFSDVKIGSEYESVIKAEGTTSWTVETDYGDNEFPTGLTLDSSDASNLKLSGQLDTVPTSGDKLITKINVKLTAEGPGGKSSLSIPLNIKGTAPKFATSSLANPYTKAGAESNTISVTGTKPMTFNAYIAVKDATAAGITTETNLVISTDAENPEANTGFYFTPEEADDGYTLTLAKAEGTGGSFKNLGVTIEADNGLGTKATTKVFKATMTGEAPVWYLVDADDGESLITLSEDFLAKPEVNFTAKKADAVNMTFKVSGDNPMTLTVNPNNDTAGLKIKTSSDNSVTIAATKSAEAKSTKVTMTAKNGDGTSKLVVTFNGQDAPVINVPTGGYVKTVEQGKKLSLALSLKSGTKPVTWGFAELEDDDATHITSSDLESKYGITLDTSKGKLEGTPETVTLSTDETTYAPVVVKVYAMNAAGSSDVDVTIGVTGGKPKLSTKTLEIDKNEELPEDGYQLAADGLASSDVTWSIEEKGNKKKLSDYVTGLELGEDGVISGDPTKSVKNASVPVIMNHFGTEAKGTVKISVYDPTPAIAYDAEVHSVDLYPKADSKGKVAAEVSKTLTLSISDDCVATGASKITWKATKPGGNVTVKIENGNTKDSLFNTAKLTITLPKGKALTLTSGDTLIEGYTTTFDLTATNSGRTTEKTDTVTITVRVAGGDGAITDKNGNIVETESALKDTMIGETKVLEEDIVTNDDLTAELGEGELTLGADRTLEMLTAGQAAVLDDGKFVIAAILPEISATADGQYGLEVDLADTVKPGAKLYWFAFPKDAPDSEDDQIADFFDIEGADTEVVPNDHIVIVYPWLREGVTYGPVIAVKAEDAESGEAVTEGELEEAAEGEEASATTEVEAPAGEAAE